MGYDGGGGGLTLDLTPAFSEILSMYYLRDYRKSEGFVQCSQTFEITSARVSLLCTIGVEPFQRCE